jgi:hypothetical protein
MGCFGFMAPPKFEAIIYAEMNSRVKSFFFENRLKFKVQGLKWGQVAEELLNRFQAGGLVLFRLLYSLKP